MAVEIKLLGDKIESGVGAEEYKAGESLKKMFETEFSGNLELTGVIFIKPNFKIHGESINDIDLVVWMRFANYTYEAFTGTQNQNKETNNIERNIAKIKRKIVFDSLLLAIEHKSHSSSGMILTNNDLKVKYPNGKIGSAILQSEKQIYALSNFTKKSEPKLGKLRLQVNNLVWMENINTAKPWGCQLTNVLFGSFQDKLNYKRFMEVVFEHSPPFESQNKNSNLFYQNAIDERSLNSSEDLNLLIENTFMFYDREHKQKQGDLSRRKLEEYVQKQLEGENLRIYQSIGEKTTIIGGIPGSGKTINLLHLAYHLASNRNNRCLVLTYNRALIADIDRLVMLSGFKTDPGSPTVGTNTCMKLMRALLVSWGIYKEPSITFSQQEEYNYFKVHFLDKYEELLNELLSFFKSDTVDEKDIEDVKNNLSELNWSKVFIDESQDWYPQERDIIYYLFGAPNCVISIGSYQLIRNITPLDWTLGTKSIQELNLKISYRQKSNLCHYIKDISNQLELKDEIEINDQLRGGQIKIYNRPLTINDYTQYYHYCVEECKNAGYDILVLINHDDNFHTTIESQGAKIHNGTLSSLKDKLPDSMEACRVFNYQSCRGLEGWIVIANNLDTFLENSAKSILEPLPMLSLAETKRKLVSQWLYMILSRPIDTLIISLKDYKSEYGQLILKTASNHSDFCDILS